MLVYTFKKLPFFNPKILSNYLFFKLFSMLKFSISFIIKPLHIKNFIQLVKDQVMMPNYKFSANLIFIP